MTRFWTNLKDMANNINFILIMGERADKFGFGKAPISHGRGPKKNLAKKIKDDVVMIRS